MHDEDTIIHITEHDLESYSTRDILYALNRAAALERLIRDLDAYNAPDMLDGYLTELLDLYR